MDKVRHILFYKGYFLDFFNNQTDKIKNKIEYILYVISAAERIPIKFFKYIEGTDGLYEIRIEYGGNIYRVFACFDEGKIVVLFNGFQKKSQKTPSSEIDKALRIKKEYFTEKVKSKGYGNKN